MRELLIAFVVTASIVGDAVYLDDPLPPPLIVLLNTVLAVLLTAVLPGRPSEPTTDAARPGPH